MRKYSNKNFNYQISKILSLNAPKEEVQLTIDTKKQISKMCEHETLDDKALKKLNDRAYQVRQHYVDTGIMTEKYGREIETQANPFPPKERAISLSPDSTPTQPISRERSKSV